MSPAAMFRSIETFKPTLLIDELDSFIDSPSLTASILGIGSLEAHQATEANA